MKSTVHFPISSNCKILVDVGDNVNSNVVLAEEFYLKQREIIPIAKLLSVRAETIHYYLKKKIDDEVLAGEILAGTKSFFSGRFIKSPVSGKLIEIDLAKGTLTLVKKANNTQPRKIKSPLKGKVKNITKTALEIEIEGEVFSILRSAGEDVIGQLVYFGKEHLGILDIFTDVEDCIVASREISPDVIVKLEVMGARGLIVTKGLDRPNLPWGEINTEVFKKLAAFEGKMIWLRPAEKQMVVID